MQVLLFMVPKLLGVAAMVMDRGRMQMEGEGEGEGKGHAGLTIRKGGIGGVEWMLEGLVRGVMRGMCWFFEYGVVGEQNGNESGKHGDVERYCLSLE